ncbi:MAG: HAMP domain-containing protein [Anaerolineales bacterium]|nr:HAMP domain-containing protein [Anaerolineales bacterium]
MFKISNVSVKIGAGLLAFLLMVAVVTSLIVKRGFDQAEQSAVQLSADGLQSQSKLTLMQLAQQQAQLYDRELQRAARMTIIAADFMEKMHATGKSVDWSNTKNVVYESSQLTLSPDGLLYYDGNPNRTTEILHIGSITPDATTDKSLRDSAILEELFPSLLSQVETGSGIYFQGTQLTFRYYPVRNLPELEIENGAAEAAQSARIEDLPVAPNNNPDRKTIWMPPYLDDAGQGLLVSADTPIYYGDEFQGFIGIDVSLSRLDERLNTIKPTAGSFIFLMDADGKLISISPENAQQLSSRELTADETSPNGLLGLTLQGINPELAKIMTPNTLSQSGTLDIDLNGQPASVAYAPLPNLNWSLSIVVPLNEVTAKSQEVSSAIQQNGSATVRNTLLVTGIFFLIAGFFSVLLSLRFITGPIMQMMNGVRSITAGNLNVSVPVIANDELGELATSFNQMTSELKHRTHELSQTSAELQVKEAQLKVATLEERQRLARELHDSVSQALYGIALGARTAQTQLERDPAKLAEPLDYILSLAEAGLSEMRALIFELRPESLQNEGLVAALTKQADAIHARHKINVVTDFGDEPDISLDAKEALYRIAQEALQNVAKHAHATKVELSMQNKNGSLLLEIRDNGKGFDVSHEFPGHLGMKSMPERAAQIGGEFHIQSQPGEGTVITVTIPK